MSRAARGAIDSLRLERVPPDRKIEAIRTIPLFARCTSKELRLIAARVDVVDFRAGKVLTRQGSQGRECFVLLAGTVNVERDGNRLATLGPGDIIGEASLIARMPRTATVVAANDGQALVLTDRDFAQLVRDVPDLALHVLEAIGRRLPSWL